MLTESKPVTGISGTFLKSIGIVSMLFDHMGLILVADIILKDHMPGTQSYVQWMVVYQACRTVGRLAFPIFVFLLIEGFLHTRDVKRYALRLLLFGFISEIPFDLAIFGTVWHPAYQNVYVTLFVGLMVLIGITKYEGTPLLQYLCIGLGCLLSWVLKSDYHITGIILISFIYLMRRMKKMQLLLGALLAAMESSMNYGAAALAFIPIGLYNGTRGKCLFPSIFYWFYPVHLAILWMLAKWVM